MKIVFNIPNTLSALRICSVPIFVYLLIQPEAWMRQLAFLIFALASLTDLIDGYWARKYHQETELGRFLDPLADKALVTGVLLTFLSITEQIQIWMVLCILGRDILITFLRYLAIRKKSALRTSVFGKVKTAFQMFSLFMVILSFLIISYRERVVINQMYKDEKENYGLGSWKVAVANLEQFLYTPSTNSANILFALASFLPYFLMLITTTLTVISGLRYLYTNYSLLLPPYSKQRNTSPA